MTYILQLLKDCWYCAEYLFSSACRTSGLNVLRTRARDRPYAPGWLPLCHRGAVPAEDRARLIYIHSSWWQIMMCLPSSCVIYDFTAWIADEDFTSSPFGCVREFPCFRAVPLHLGSAHSRLSSLRTTTNLYTRDGRRSDAAVAPQHLFLWYRISRLQLPPRRHVLVFTRGNLGGGPTHRCLALLGALWTGHARQRGSCRSTSRSLYSIHRRMFRTRD